MKDSVRLTANENDAGTVHSIALSPSEPASPEPLCSIVHLKRQAQEGWCKAYEVGNRSFVIDLPILLPEVDKMPVVTVQWGKDRIIPASTEPLVEADEYGFGFALNSPWAPQSQLECKHLPLSSLTDSNLACFKKGSLSIASAAHLIQTKVETYTQGNLQIIPDSLSVFSPHKYNRKEQDSSIAQGYYEIQFRQALCGIPILESISSTLHHGVKEKGSGYPMPTAYVASPDAYWFGTGYMTREEVLYEDVPVYPLTALQKKWNALVESGQIAEVESIRLGYVLYLGREPAPRIWAIPSWVMRCACYKPLNDAQGYYHKQQLIFNAQTGALAEMDNVDAKAAYCPPLVTWEDSQSHPTEQRLVNA